jgi:MEMO1 family protein
MANTSSLVFAGIAPHPPIMVPEVGREAIVEVRDSIEAMADLTARVIQSGAETIVIISPHAPLESKSFVAYEGPELYGDFANFRAPSAILQARLDVELLHEITRTAASQNLILNKITGFDLDHGTAVPLYFLQRNGWHGRLVALGYSFLSNADHLRFGNCIRQAIDNLGRPVAFIASGDLSHRLKREAPAGYNPDAHYFDEEVVGAIRTCSLARIAEIDHELRRLAGECGYRSMLVAIGAITGSEGPCEVISYEAPFGVGYMVAQLSAASARVPAATSAGSHSDDKSPPEAGNAEQAQNEDQKKIPALARQTIETFILTGRIIAPPRNLPEIFQPRAGCFVSIKTHAGELRGCIGTIEPIMNTLAEEIIANAVNAATRDPRFPAVRQEELPDLKYSVDVLSAPEPTILEDLDPKIYGVIVEDESGTNRGLLLPNLEGIDTAARQVELTSHKAGITPGAKVRLFRFRAERYRE